VLAEGTIAPGFSLYDHTGTVHALTDHREAVEPFADMRRRISYLIDPAGRIRRTYRVEDAAAHAAAAAADLRTIVGAGAR
jgi:peroxiredoxin